MGTDVKLLSAAFKLFSTSCISSFSAPPISCAENKKHSGLIFHVLAVYTLIFKPITFQELRSYLTSNPYTSFRFHSMHTPQHRTASVVSFLSIPHAPFMQSVTTQAIFPRISSDMFLSSTES
jgi:hypothetical protein